MYSLAIALDAQLWELTTIATFSGPPPARAIDVSKTSAAERNIWIEADDDVLEYLIDHGGYDPQLGARPMRQTLQRLLEGPVADMILRGGPSEGDTIVVTVVDGDLELEILDEG